MKVKARTVLRMTLLAAAVLAASGAIEAAGLTGPVRAASVLPALSPFAALLSLGGRHAFDWMSLLALPIVALSLWRGRWFCRNVCPTGYVLELAGRLSRRARTKRASWPNVGRWLAVIGLGSAAAGYPLVIWLDPLSLFNGFVSAWRWPFVWTSFLPATGLVVLALFSLWRPGMWCAKVCPLGATQDWVRRIVRRRGLERPKGEGPVLERRAFLYTAAGAAVGLLTKRLGLRGRYAVLRPPGARAESDFVALCQRCGNCLRACPTRILFPDLGEAGVAGLFAPVMRLRGGEAGGYCREDCNECMKACPAGAIERISLSRKPEAVIGIARVRRSRCISWEDGGTCMVCRDVCPYEAIRGVVRWGTECPVVMPSRCVGCGACEVECPVEGKRAIIVEPSDRCRAGGRPKLLGNGS